MFLSTFKYSLNTLQNSTGHVAKAVARGDFASTLSTFLTQNAINGSSIFFRTKLLSIRKNNSMEVSG